MKKTVNITYFVHGTTVDNERGIATGWLDGELSEAGKEELRNLKELIKDKKFDVVFCSDLKRAVDSAMILFENRVPIITDRRLRECDYGDLTGADSKVVHSSTLKFIRDRFPNGESYLDVEKRVQSFLKDLLERYPGKEVAVVSHRGPQLALEVLLNGKSWEQAVKDDWRSKKPKEWRPGWNYTLQG